MQASPNLRTSEGGVKKRAQDARGGIAEASMKGMLLVHGRATIRSSSRMLVPEGEQLLLPSTMLSFRELLRSHRELSSRPKNSDAEESLPN
jgi:hypothetical protein